MKDDNVYLEHVLSAISKIEEYVRDFTQEGFLKNVLVQDGVMREMEIIGEASKNLSPEFKEKLPEIPWRDVIGMRNKLIHDYFEVDIDAVWKTVQEDLPFLKSEFLKLKR
jgi:uncharacterized protein with HEPN domain